MILTLEHGFLELEYLPEDIGPFISSANAFENWKNKSFDAYRNDYATLSAFSKWRSPNKKISFPPQYHSMQEIKLTDDELWALIKSKGQCTCASGTEVRCPLIDVTTRRLVLSNQSQTNGFAERYLSHFKCLREISYSTYLAPGDETFFRRVTKLKFGIRFL